MEAEAVRNVEHSNTVEVEEAVSAAGTENQVAMSTAIVINPSSDIDTSSHHYETVNAREDAETLQNGTVEELPEYASIVTTQGVNSTDSDRNRVIYENLSSVNKDVEAARERTLISEAPPTYRQLFGQQKNKSPTLRQKLTRCRRSDDQSWFQKFKEGLKNNKIAATFFVSGGILLLLSLPISMIIIGGLNVSVCLRHEIPLYLLIGGFVLIAEIIFQSAICIGMKRGNSNHETFCCTLRLCDCLAIFLFVWLLVGTYWIFTISLSRTSCESSVDDIAYANTTVLTDSEGGTQVPIVTPSSSSTPSRGCSDCDNYVYSFTAFVIMFQYLALLIAFIFCCSVYFKKYGR